MVAICTLIGEDVSYATNDDTFLNMIAAGAFGRPVSAYLIHMNYLWGWFLSQFYALFPGINWFFWWQYLLNILAVASLCALAVRKISDVRIVALLSALINLVLRYDVYTNLQYTKSAYLYCAAGIAWMLLSRDKGRRDWIMGGAFLTLGFLFREESFYLGITFCGAALCYQCLLHRARVGEVLRGFTPCLLFLLIAFMVNTIAYSSADWREFKRFNRARMAVEDHVGMNYDRHRTLYEAAGVTKLQSRMLTSYLYIDMELATADVLETAEQIEYEAEDIYRFDLEVLSETIRCVAGVATGMLFPKTVALLAVGFLVLGRKRERLAALVSVCVVLGVYWYFLCGNRVVWRAEFGAWLFPFAFLLYEGEDLCRRALKWKHTGRVAAGMAAVIAIFFLGTMALQFRDVKDKVIFRDRGSKTPVYASFNAAADKTGEFLFGQDTEITMNPVEITRSRYEGLFRHYCFTGSWVAISPTGLHYLRETIGMEGNPVCALIEHENAYYRGSEQAAALLREDLERICREPVELIHTEEGGWRFALRTESVVR